MNIEKEIKMKNPSIHVLAILTLFALLTIHFGCASSPPSRFYQLSSLDTTSPGMKPSLDEQCVSLGIGPVKIPDYLDQTKIVTRGEGNQLTLAEFDRWAERFKDNLGRVLAKNLSTLLCTKTVVLFPWRGGTPIDYRIEMEVLRLDGSLGGNVSLEAWWMILSGDGKKMVLSKKSIFTEAVTGKDYNSLVSAESRALGHLSREIAEGLKALPRQS
jgi:uncharacterized lipoprotein YmbA